MEVGCSSFVQSKTILNREGKKDVKRKERNITQAQLQRIQERDALKSVKNQEVRLDNSLSNDKASHRSLHIPHRVSDRTRA